MSETISIANMPPSAGSYVINGHLYIQFPKKPCAWNRFWTRVLLGWVWVDESESK